MRMLPLCWMRPTGLPHIIEANPGDMSSFLVQGPSFSISSSSTPGIPTTGIYVLKLEIQLPWVIVVDSEWFFPAIPSKKN